MAATGVNVKMGVSGVSQFKQSINAAKTSMKTLDAQLALTEKQYKATGDQEAYMQEKSELLKAKLEEQKAVVAQAEKALAEMTSNGVDKSSKAFQSMQQEMLRAKGDLLDTQAQLDNVAGSSQDVSDGVSEMNANMKRIGDGVSWQNVTEGLESITSGMEKVITKAWDMGKAIVTNTLGAGEWADELVTTATQYEISPEQLQRMRKTEQLIDTSTDTILSSQDKLKRGLEKGDKNTMGALAALGVTEWENTEDAFWKAGEAIGKLGSEEDKVEYATRLFGKSWRELMPLFKAGREEYEKTNASWHVVSQDQIDSLTGMDDQFQRMQGEWETFKTTLWATFSGPLTKGMEILTGLLEKLNDYLATEEGQAMMQKLSDTMTGLVENLLAIDPDQVISGLQEVFDRLMKGLEWLADPKNMEKVTGAIKLFIGAWAGLKTATGVSTALKLFNGLGGLFGGGGGAVATAGGGTGTAITTTLGTKLATAGSAIGKFFAAGGGISMLTPAAVLAAGILPAMLADNWDRNQINQRTARRMDAAGKMSGPDADWLAAMAAALGVGDSGLQSDYASQERLLMGMGSRGTIEKAKLLASLAGKTVNGRDAQLELMEYWRTGATGVDSNGYTWDASRVTGLAETVADSYETFATRTDALAVTATKQDEASGKMVSAAELLEGLPEKLDSAIREGMASITIVLDGERVGQAITGQVSYGMGRMVQAMTR